MKSTSYKTQGLKEIIQGLVKVYQPKTVVELGTQQGSSAVLIAKHLKGRLTTVDLFEEKYRKPPFNKTHANYLKAIKNIYLSGEFKKVTILVEDALLSHLHFNNIDMLHIDICNHYDNVKPILKNWYKKVTKFIILEGGTFNHWQRKGGFKSFYPILEEKFIKDNYDKCVITGDGDYALTILIRK